jgi:hypothetical protein
MAIRFEVSPFVLTAGDIIIPRVPGSSLDLGSLDITASSIIFGVSSVTDIVAANGITELTDPVMQIQSSTAGDCDITANPQIVAGTTGELLKLVGSSNSKTVTFHTGDGLLLKDGQSFTLGLGDILTLLFIGSTWLEDHRSYNK